MENLESYGSFFFVDEHDSVGDGGCKVKALTLHEPYATLIAHGYKEVETRDWYTSYRGPLAIHAAKRTPPEGVELCRVTFAQAEQLLILPALTFGAVVCTCQLVACLPSEMVEYKSKQLKEWFEPARGWAFERLFGNYDAGRWAWILRGVQRLDHPAAARGLQKLWEWEATEKGDA